MQAYAASPPDAVDIPRAQRRPVRQPLQWYFEHHDRDAAIVLAFINGGYTQFAIARATGLSASRVSRVIKAAEAKGKT
jgi:putative transposase